MKTVRKAIALLALLGWAAGAAESAGLDTLHPEQSRIAFVYRQMNVPVEGQFGRFSGQIRFDPARPTEGRAEIEIDLASIDAGSPDANQEVAGSLWFETQRFPVARFDSTSIKPLGGDRYEVAGRMTIKGRTLDASAPVTLHWQGESAVLEGGLVLKRADYGIGEGIWADFGTVANEVQIQFRLVATSAAGEKQ